MATSISSISTIRPVAKLAYGDLITLPTGELAWVVWVDSSDIGYRDLDGGDYHERAAHAEYRVWLEHPAHVMGADRVMSPLNRALARAGAY